MVGVGGHVYSTVQHDSLGTLSLASRRPVPKRKTKKKGLGRGPRGSTPNVTGYGRGARPIDSQS